MPQRRHNPLRLLAALPLTALLTAVAISCSQSPVTDTAIFLGESFTVYPDSVTDTEHRCARALSPMLLESNFPTAGDSMVQLPLRPAARCSISLESPSMLLDAVHNLSLADLDSIDTKRASTARLAYIVELALAYTDPAQAMKLLRSRVDSDGRIMQGYSRGGGWPVATDAIAWATAAWAVYNTTGSRRWLEESFRVITLTLKRYEAVATAPNGLTPGLQSDPGYGEAIPYPEWMTAADVAASTALSPSVLTARAWAVAAMMAVELEEDPKPYERRSAAMRDSINFALWLPNLSGYSQYAYCQPFPITSMTLDNFGQALAMAYDIPTPEMREAMLQRVPMLPLGIPAMYPQMPDSTVNPSNALVPAVLAYWALAAARAGNLTMLYRNIYSMMRTTAMNLGNYPCVDINDGEVPQPLRGHGNDPLSAAANLAAIHRAIFGVTFTTYGIELRPRIAPQLTGEKRLGGLRYRDAVIDIRIKGTGSVISSFSIDSIEQTAHIIPAGLRGHHCIDVVMAGNNPRIHPVNVVTNGAMPPTPSMVWDTQDAGHITPYISGDAYEVMLNGVLMQQIFTDTYTMARISALSALSVVPVRGEQYVGYASAPKLFVPRGLSIRVPADSLAYPGTQLVADRKVAMQFAETTASRRSRMRFTVDAPVAGRWWLYVTYANGLAAPLQRSNVCALRRLQVNDTTVAVPLVMPPTAKDDWTVTQRSNMVPITLRKGPNRLNIFYSEPECLNSHRDLNTALIREVILLCAE